MAEKEKAGDEAEGSSGGGKKMIIIIAIVAVVAIAASVGVTLFLLGGDSSEGGSESEPVEEVKLEALYMDLKPALIVTYNEGSKQRFLQATLSVMSRSQEALDAVELHMPVIRNRLINAYGSKDFQSLQTHEGRLGLLEETKTTLNEVLSEQGVDAEVESVLFQNLVLQ